MLSHITTAPYMLNIPTYKVEIVNNSMGITLKDIDQVEIHPIEWDGMLFFSDGKKDSKKTFSIYAEDIIELKKASETKGKVLKKADLVVEIIFRAANTFANTQNRIRVNLEDKYVDDFVDSIQLVRDKALDVDYWICKVINDLSLMFTIPKELQIHPRAPFLADYEQLIWYNTNIRQDKKEKNKIISLEALTNYRVFEYNFEQHRGNGILIPLLEDVKIKNNSFTDVANPIGTYTDYYNSIADNARKVSNLTIGDLAFFTEGKPTITFRQVGDPDRLVSAIKGIIQQGNIKLADKILDKENTYKDEALIDNTETDLKPKISKNPLLAQFPNIVKKTKDSSTSRVSNTREYVSEMSKSVTIYCIKCGNSNPSSSKFCNNCGSKLESRCPQCGYVFQEGSRFCNSCGFNLSNNNNPQASETTQTSTSPGILKENYVEFDTCELLEYGIKILYPTNWTKYDHGVEPPNVAFFFSPKEDINDQFLDGLGISVTPNPLNAVTLDNVLKLNLDNLRVSNPDFVLDESNESTLSHQPAHRIVYRDGGFKTLMVFSLKYSTNASSLITMCYRAKQSSYDKFLSEVIKMIDSFEFTDENAAHKLL